MADAVADAADEAVAEAVVEAVVEAVAAVDLLEHSVRCRDVLERRPQQSWQRREFRLEAEQH